MESEDRWRKAVADSRRKRASLDAQRPIDGPERLRFIKLEKEPKVFTIRSPLTWWHSHFCPGDFRSRRCGFDRCVPCSAGLPVQTRFVLAIDLEDVGTRLLELTERQRPFLEILRLEPTGQVGAIVKGWKAWGAPNAPIRLELLGYDDVIPIEIDRLVSSLGLPPQLHPEAAKSIDPDPS